MKPTLLLAFLALLPLDLHAQVLRVDEDGRGEITETDAKATDGSYIEEWSFQAQVGKAYDVTFRSNVLFVALKVLDKSNTQPCQDKPACPSTSLILAGLATVLRYVPVSGTTGTIVVRTLGPQLGAYSLSVTEVGAPAQAPARSAVTAPAPAPSGERAGGSP